MGSAESEVGSTAAELQVIPTFLMNAHLRHYISLFHPQKSLFMIISFPFFPLLKSSLRSSRALLPLVLLAVGCLCASCQPEPKVKLKEVEVNITFADFEVTYVDDSSSDANPLQVSDKTASEAGVNRISLAIFNTAGQLAYSATRNAETDPETFDQISCLLLPGDYTFVAVAHRTTAPDDAAALITSPTQATITTAKLLSTYAYSQAITILADQANNVVIDFGLRISSTLQFVSIDDTPDEVVSCELIVNPTVSAASNFTFNPTTGFASAPYQYKVVQLKSATGGTFKNVLFNVHCLLTQNPELVDFTVNMKDASGAVVRTRTFSDIELAPHRTTRLAGPFFHSAVESSYIFDTSEDPRVDITF